MLQIVRRLHNGTTALVGLMCSMLCDEIGSLAAFFDAAFISAGGCFGSVDMMSTSTYATFVKVVPSDQSLGTVYTKVIQKFRQVTVFIMLLYNLLLSVFIARQLIGAVHNAILL